MQFTITPVIRVVTPCFGGAHLAELALPEAAPVPDLCADGEHSVQGDAMRNGVQESDVSLQDARVRSAGPCRREG